MVAGHGRRAGAAGPGQRAALGLDRHQPDRARRLDGQRSAVGGPTAGAARGRRRRRLLAVTGFWVSIAANVRQRRAESALLAALGVTQRSAAAQLFLEKLLLSVPSAALGLLLGTIVARLLVPAVTLTTTAQLPVPPPVTLFDLPQTIPLAVAVAVLPALAAALVIFRRPDPAAELRAAEAA